MADQWQDSGLLSVPIRDDDAPDNWEDELEEKFPKLSNVEEKSKVTVKATDNKRNKKKDTNDEETRKIIKQPDGDYTPEQLDQIESKRKIEEETNKLDMVTELVTTNDQHQSLDNISLVTKDEFTNYCLRLCNHLDKLSKSEFYPEFVDHFLNGLTNPMPVDGVRRLSAKLDAILIRKQDEKKQKPKPKKASAKPKLRTIQRADFNAYGNEGGNYSDPDGDYDEDD